MSSRRDELNDLISSTRSISFSNWVTLLNYFDQNKTELTVSDVRMLVTECEKQRKELNKTITDKIEKADTNPNIYSYLKDLEAKEAKPKSKQILRIEHKKESAHLPIAAMSPQ